MFDAVLRTRETEAMLTLLIFPLLLVRSLFAAHGTAQEVGAKWLSRLQQSTQEMTAGVQRVTVAPGQAAAAKKQKWINSLADSATQDKWERNVRAVGLTSWQESMTGFGIARVAAGAQAKLAKFEQALEPLLRHIDQGVQQVRAMPDDTFEARLQRSTAMQRWMHNYRRPGA